MSGIGLVLSIAKDALAAQRYGLSVTAHNIANVNTPGYSRQSAVFEPKEPAAYGGVLLGRGVDTTDVLRATDQFMENRLMQKKSTMSSSKEMESYMQVLEGLFSEESEMSISTMLSDFWNSWNDIANNPSGAPERIALYEHSILLSGQFNSLDADLRQLEIDLTGAMSAGTERINQITSEIGQLNDQIAGMEIGRVANDLRDKRNTLISELSEYLDVKAFEQNNGSMTVLTAKGCVLVNGNDSYELEMGGDLGDRVLWEGSGGNEVDITDYISNGKLGGWLDMRDEVVAKYKLDLDALAAEFIWTVNQQHSQGVGLKLFSTDLTGTYETGSSGLLSTLTYGQKIDYTENFRMWIDNGTALSDVTMDMGISTASLTSWAGTATGAAQYKYAFTVTTAGTVGADANVTEIDGVGLGVVQAGATVAAALNSAIAVQTITVTDAASTQTVSIADAGGDATRSAKDIARALSVLNGVTAYASDNSATIDITQVLDGANNVQAGDVVSFTLSSGGSTAGVSFTVSSTDATTRSDFLIALNTAISTINGTGSDLSISGSQLTSDNLVTITSASGENIGINNSDVQDLAQVTIDTSNFANLAVDSNMNLSAINAGGGFGTAIVSEVDLTFTTMSNADTVTLDVNGTTYTSGAVGADFNETMTNLAIDIATDGDVATAVWDDIDKLTITSVAGDQDVLVTNLVGGADLAANVAAGTDSTLTAASDGTLTYTHIGTTSTGTATAEGYEQITLDIAEKGAAATTVTLATMYGATATRGGNFDAQLATVITAQTSVTVTNSAPGDGDLILTSDNGHNITVSALTAQKSTLTVGVLAGTESTLTAAAGNLTSGGAESYASEGDNQLQFDVSGGGSDTLTLELTGLETTDAAVVAGAFADALDGTTGAGLANVDLSFVRSGTSFAIAAGSEIDLTFDNTVDNNATRLGGANQFTMQIDVDGATLGGGEDNTLTFDTVDTITATSVFENDTIGFGTWTLTESGATDSGVKTGTITIYLDDGYSIESSVAGTATSGSFGGDYVGANNWDNSETVSFDLKFGTTTQSVSVTTDATATNAEIADEIASDLGIVGPAGSVTFTDAVGSVTITRNGNNFDFVTTNGMSLQFLKISDPTSGDAGITLTANASTHLTSGGLGPTTVSVGGTDGFEADGGVFNELADTAATTGNSIITLGGDGGFTGFSAGDVVSFTIDNTNVVTYTVGASHDTDIEFATGLETALNNAAPALGGTYSVTRNGASVSILKHDDTPIEITGFADTTYNATLAVNTGTGVGAPDPASTLLDAVIGSAKTSATSTLYGSEGVISWKKFDDAGAATGASGTISVDDADPFTVDGLTFDIGDGTLVGGNTFTINTDATGTPDRLVLTASGTARSLLDTYTFSVSTGGGGTIGTDTPEIAWSNGTTSGTVDIIGAGNYTVDGMTLNFQSGTLFAGDTFTITTDADGTPTANLPSAWHWTLESFKDQFNSQATGEGVTALVTSNNALTFSPNSGYSFGFCDHNYGDSGLLAALGINTFFEGRSAGSIGMNEQIRNKDYIAAGKINNNVGLASSATGNTSTGSITTSGPYTGVSDATYTIRIEPGGATFTWKKDNGEWSALPTDISIGSSQTINQGVTLTFSPGTYVGGDTFTMAVTASPDPSLAYSIGDNTNALAITNLQDTSGEIREWACDRLIGNTQGTVSATIENYYHSVVGSMGIKASSIERSNAFNELMVQKLSGLRDSISAVSLDEEMTNLIKFQYAYQAAAKLISVSDDLLNTLLSIK